MTFDISGLNGRTVLLRFVVVTTEGPLLAAVDGVSIGEPIT
jgi:hypothetical protein